MICFLSTPTSSSALNFRSDPIESRNIARVLVHIANESVDGSELSGEKQQLPRAFLDGILRSRKAGLPSPERVS